MVNFQAFSFVSKSHYASICLLHPEEVALKPIPHWPGRGTDMDFICLTGLGCPASGGGASRLVECEGHLYITDRCIWNSKQLVGVGLITLLYLQLLAGHAGRSSCN